MDDREIPPNAPELGATSSGSEGESSAKSGPDGFETEIETLNQKLEQTLLDAAQAYNEIRKQLDDVVEQLEKVRLERDNEFSKAALRDINQRFWARRIAQWVGISLLIWMAGLQTHLVHKVFWGPVTLASPAFTVAIIVAPIVSMTTIALALFVGAFRKFEDKDMSTLGNGASTAAGWFGN